nr:GGDEF domain-containing protein [Ancylobacter lacus]
MSDELFLYPERPILHHDDWWEFGFPDPAERAAAHAEWLAKLQAARREAGRVQFSEWSVRCRDGSRRTVQFRYRWIGPYYVLALWDVTSQRETERELRHLAVSDPLTGLWNRRRFEEDVALALDAFSQWGRGFGLLLIDIDHFKAINDRFGHLSGDEVLRAVAARCRRQLRQADLLARIGGEEFAVLLPDMNETEAERVGRRLLTALAATPVEVGGHRIIVTLSIGCVVPRPQEDAASLFARADDALYRAKAEGRNSLCCGSPAPQATAPRPVMPST